MNLDDPTPGTSSRKGLTDSPVPTPEDLVDAAKRLDPESQREVVQTLMASVSMPASLMDPVRQKINEEHVSQYIKLAGLQDERDYDLAKQQENRRDTNRYFGMVIFFMSMAFVIFACVFFSEDRETLETILAFAGGIVAGGFGGYGFAKSRSDAS